MPWQVDFTRSAEQQLRALPRRDQRRLAARIDALADNPRPPGVKKLAGEESLYRLRSGDYRILYTVKDALLIVLIIKIGHRRDVYR